MQTIYITKTKENSNGIFLAKKNAEHFSMDRKIDCNLADTAWKQAIGLMFSKPKNILFKFNSSRRWEFWMLFVPYGIWMAFLDDDGGVFELIKAEKMTLNPKTWRVYKPSRACKYVLEMHSKSVEVGDKIEW